MPQKENIVLSKLYQDLTLPFKDYIDIVVNNDLSKLIIEGTPTTEELNEAWQTINELYIDAIADLDTKIRIEDAKEIAYLEGRINLAEIIIKQLRLNYTDELALSLSEFGYPIMLPTKENFEKFVIQFRGYLKADLLTLEEKIKEQPKEKKGENPTKQYFEKVVVAIELTFKFSINIEQITTGKYCEYVSSYNDYCKKLKDKVK